MFHFTGLPSKAVRFTWVGVKSEVKKRAVSVQLLTSIELSCVVWRKRPAVDWLD